MRCPACGFVSFDALSTCKQCGKEMPRPGKADGSVASTRPEGTIAGAPQDSKAGLAPYMTGKGVSAYPLSVMRTDLPELAAEGAPAGLASSPKAGFWLRCVAFLIDVAVVALLGTGGGMLVDLSARIGGMVSSASEAGVEWLSSTATTLLVVLIALCYFTMFVGMRGQTPGKMLLGLKVVRTDGEAIGFGRALVRWMGQCLSLLILGVGFLMVAFSGRKQGLHDKIAGTYVVRHPS